MSRFGGNGGQPQRRNIMVEARNVNVAEALELLEGGALLLDVREDNEWEAGRAPNATHIALHEVPDHLDELATDRLIVCVCRSGARSGRAANFLVEHGHDAANLEGGMLAWNAESEPLISDEGEPTVI
jgi:rhodanese-related sulfurtransferase